MYSIINFFNSRVKRFTIFDVKLLQGIGILVGLIVAKLFPQIMEISLWWFAAFLIVFIIRPFYLVYLQR